MKNRFFRSLIISVIVCCTSSSSVIAQICPLSRGSQSGNLGSGGFGYSKTYRENLNDDKAYAIYNNKIVRVGGVTMEGEAAQFVTTDSLSGQPIKNSKPSANAIHWKIETKKAQTKKNNRK